MDVVLTSFFTKNGVPTIGITPTIRIWEVTGTSHSLIVGGPDPTMVEVGDGFYKFSFTDVLGFDPKQDYVFRADAGSSFLDYERYVVGSTLQTVLPDTTIDEIVDGVWDEPGIDHINSGSTGLLLNEVHADTAQVRIDLNTAISLVSTLLKYETNRTKIDKTNNTLTVYDDNCTDVLQVFDLKDFNGNPSVVEVCERIPTSCP